MWFKINGLIGHQGAGKYNDISVYIKAKDVCEVLNLYKRVPSIKNKSYCGRVFPDVFPLSDVNRIKKLENIIENDESVINKKSWYYIDYLNRHL